METNQGSNICLIFDMQYIQLILEDGGLEKWKQQNRIQNSSWKKMMC